MKKTLVSVAVTVLLGTSGFAFAQANGDANSLAIGLIADASSRVTDSVDSHDDNSTNRNSLAFATDRAVVLNNGSSGRFANAFNVSTATASTALTGAVTGNTVREIGNQAVNLSSARGGDGGNARSAAIGFAAAGGGDGGNGGDGGGSIGVGVGVGVGLGDEGIGVGVGASRGGRGAAGAAGGAATASAGSNTSGAAVGAAGGAGGSNAVDAGRFAMSNSMNSAARAATGVVVMSQQTGVSSLVQQSVNVQANLALR